MKYLLLLFIGFVSMTAQAEFAPNNLRYISLYDFQNKLSPFFSEIWNRPTNNIASNCFSDPASFGFNFPATGAPMSSGPTNSTIRKLQTCVNRSLDEVGVVLYSWETSYDQVKILLSHFFPAEMIQKSVNEKNFHEWAMGSFSQLSENEKKAIIKNLVENMLGTDEVIASYGLINDMEKFNGYLATQILPTDRLLETIQKLMLVLILRDEFLTY